MAPGRPCFRADPGCVPAWRAGPAAGADARYMVVAADDLNERYTFRLQPDGSGEGVGPDGKTHARFRLWKEAIRDA